VCFVSICVWVRVFQLLMPLISHVETLQTPYSKKTCRQQFSLL